jgi:pilus assembly protein Flp/PilA
MRSMLKSVLHFLKREDGPTAVECALMLALVVIVCIVAINSVNSPENVNEPVVVESTQR